MLSAAITHMQEVGYGHPAHIVIPPDRLEERLKTGGAHDLREVRQHVREFAVEQFYSEVDTLNSSEDLRNNKTWLVAKDLISTGDYDFVESEILSLLSDKGIYLRVFVIPFIVIDSLNGGKAWVETKANEASGRTEGPPEAKEIALKHLQKQKKEVVRQLMLQESEIRFDAGLHDPPPTEAWCYEERPDLPRICRSEREKPR